MISSTGRVIAALMFSLPVALAAASAGDDSVLAATSAARARAEAADAPRLAAARWAAAESRFQSATARLEHGDQRGAGKAGHEAEALYRDAELDALKAALLTEARRQVLAMDQAKAERLAPKTAARAHEFLQKADAALTADRQQTDEPRRLAGEAAREAQHAIAIAGLVRQLHDAKATNEDLLLEWEASLTGIAGAAGGAVDVTGGPRPAADAAAAAVLALRQRADSQDKDLQDRNRQLAAQDEEIRELESRLSGASTEARGLNMELQRRKQAEQRLHDLTALFSPEEAVVLREADKIIVRLKGLGFGSGSAKLGPATAGLLNKARQAVALFPRAEIVVEGHTDDSGDAAANQRLSQNRAEAVRAWLAEKSGRAAGEFGAIGYGDSRPIASNATVQGRGLNRRIDLVIAPEPAGR